MIAEYLIWMSGRSRSSTYLCQGLQWSDDSGVLDLDVGQVTDPVLTYARACSGAMIAEYLIWMSGRSPIQYLPAPGHAAER